MTDEQARLKEHFLEPETRDGYFIDAKMKAAWKEMLDIVEEFARICDKYGLNYSLAGGTLLGAVRHKGFIPWDDDIDIDMERKDYEVFLAVAEKELKYPLCLQTPVTDPERVTGFAQIRNCETTAIDRDWIGWRARFNMGIGIDIFPIDGIPAKGSRGHARFLRRLGLIQGIYAAKVGYASGNAGCLRLLKKAAGTGLYDLIGARRLFALRERIYARNSLDKCDLCGEISFRLDHNDVHWSPRCYDSYEVVPFEYLNLKIASGYNEILTSKYGDWRKPAKINGFHPPLILHVDIPYKRVLVEQFGYKKAWVEHLPGSF